MLDTSIMIDFIFEFIKNNINYILLIFIILSLIFNIIFLLYKKVPIKKIIKVISLVPSLIHDAESVFPISKNGDNKKQFVKDFYYNLLDKYNIQKYSKYIDIDNIIEEVLQCPMKKE